MSEDVCVLCEEPIGPGEDAPPVSPGRAHRECLLRAVVGGIGHHEDHAYWCTQMRDPDGGRTYRQSAIEVDALMARPVTRISPHGSGVRNAVPNPD